MNWKEAKILFVFPSRSRPAALKSSMLSITSRLNKPELSTVLITLDGDDYHGSTYDEVLFYVQGIKIVKFVGTSKNKIDAINRDILKYNGDYDIVICMSDDMKFITNGFDDIIRSDFELYFPDGDGCLHYPDQNQGSNCMTMNITDKKYFDRFKYIYHPDYVSVECDLENQEVAQMLGRYRYVESRIFDHNHPSFGHTQYDEQYRKTEDIEVHEKDKATRRRRKANNYDLVEGANGWESVPPLQVNDEPPIIKPDIAVLNSQLYSKLSEVNEIMKQIQSL